MLTTRHAEAVGAAEGDGSQAGVHVAGSGVGLDVQALLANGADQRLSGRLFFNQRLQRLSAALTGGLFDGQFQFPHACTFLQFGANPRGDPRDDIGLGKLQKGC